jgi:hypothetical protein
VDTAVSDLAVSLASADYLQMPELVQVERWVELPPRARAMYDAMEADLVLQIDGQDIIAASAGVLVNKLLQIASGCLYDQDRQVHELHQAKLDALAELLEAQPGPVLLLYPYKPDWERIQARFKGAKHISAPGALDAFRAGGVKLLGMHPASGAHGVDGLQGASSAMVWYGATYNADHWAQAIKRLHRDGQRAGRVVVHQILAADTIEEYVAGKALSAKLTLQEHLLAAVSMRRHRHALLTSDV